MPIVSNEYCPRCNKMVVVEEQEFIGGVEWVCTECRLLVDWEYDDNETFIGRRIGS